MKVDTKLRNLCQQTLFYPMLYDRLHPLVVLLSIKDNNATVIAPYCSTKLQRLECASAIAIATTYAIADTGATSIFIMRGTPVKNLRRANHIRSPLAYPSEARSPQPTSVTS